MQARDSYRSGSSRKRKLGLLRPPSGVRQGSLNVTQLQVRVRSEYLSFGLACREQAHDGADGDPQAANAGAPAHDGWVVRYPVHYVHRDSLAPGWLERHAGVRRVGAVVASWPRLACSA